MACCASDRHKAASPFGEQCSERLGSRRAAERSRGALRVLQAPAEPLDLSSELLVSGKREEEEAYNREGVRQRARPGSASARCSAPPCACGECPPTGRRANQPATSGEAKASRSGGNSAEAGSGWGAFSRYSLASDARAASCCWQLLRLALSVPIVLRSFLISSFPAKGEESCFAYQRLCGTKGSWSCCICSWLACFQKGCRTGWCLLQQKSEGRLAILERLQLLFSRLHHECFLELLLQLFHDFPLIHDGFPQREILPNASHVSQVKQIKLNVLLIRKTL